jgi:hypothetical protein
MYDRQERERHRGALPSMWGADTRPGSDGGTLNRSSPRYTCIIPLAPAPWSPRGSFLSRAGTAMCTGTPPVQRSHRHHRDAGISYTQNGAGDNAVSGVR